MNNQEEIYRTENNKKQEKCSNQKRESKPCIPGIPIKESNSQKFHIIADKSAFPNFKVVDPLSSSCSTMTSTSGKNSDHEAINEENDDDCYEDIDDDDAEERFNEEPQQSTEDSPEIGSYKKVAKWLEKTPSQASLLSSDVSIVQHDSVTTVNSSAFLRKHSKGIFIEHNGHKLPFPKLVRTNLEDHQKRILQSVANRKYNVEENQSEYTKDIDANSNGEVVWTTGLIVGSSQYKPKKVRRKSKLLERFIRKKSDNHLDEVENASLLEDGVSSSEISVRHSLEVVARNYDEHGDTDQFSELKNICKANMSSQDNQDEKNARTSTGGTSFLIYDCEKECFVKETIPYSTSEEHSHHGKKSRDAEIDQLSSRLREIQGKKSTSKPQMRTIFSYQKPVKTPSVKNRDGKISKGLYHRLTSILNNFFSAGAKLMQSYGSNMINMFRPKRSSRVVPRNGSLFQTAGNVISTCTTKPIIIANGIFLIIFIHRRQ